MTKQFIKRHAIIIVSLAILCSYLFFFRLGNMALTDPDETFYAQTAKEMLSRGEWLTPYIYGNPQFEKPILFYWLVEVSFKMFGVNEFSARLPSAIFGLIGIIAIYLLGTLIFNRRSGMLGAIILATNVEYIVLSRACVTDMVLSTFILLGILAFFYAYIKERPNFYILSSVAFGLATLTKGPIGLFLPGLAIAIHLLITKELKILKDIRIFWSAIIFLIVVLPWYVIAYLLHGSAFIDAFFGFHNVTRFLEPEHKIGSQFYYYIPIVMGGFFPWSAFLPVGLWQITKNVFSRKIPVNRHSLFLLLWFLIIFLFFSASSTKLPTYVFPSFAALALITAFAWDDFLKKNEQFFIMKSMRYSYYLLLAVMFCGVFGLYMFIKMRYPIIMQGAIISGAMLLIGMSLSLGAFVNKKYILTFFFIVYSIMIFLYPLSTLILPEIEYYETSKGIARELLAHMGPKEKLASESHYLAGLAFYTDKFPLDIDKHHILVGFLNSDKRVWCVIKEKNHRQLYELDTKPFYTKPSYMVYKIGKRCIVTNMIPDDGKYLLKRERIK